MQNVLSPLIYVAAFVAVVLLVQAVSALFFTSRDRNRRVNRRLTMLESGMKPAEVHAALVRVPVYSASTEMLFRGVLRRLPLVLQQADIAASPSALLFYFGGAAFALWLLSIVRFGLAIGPLFLSLLASIALSGCAAWFWIARRRNKRLRALEEQMPLALDIVNRGLRAGHPVVSAITLAANELGDPVGSEFGLIVDETTYGLEFKDALKNFAYRSGSADAHFFAVSVGVQAQTGGNLAEILGNLASVIRGRSTLRKRVKALSSEGRASAAILSALPAILIGFIGLSSPTYYTSTFSDPIFWPSVAVVLVLYAMGQVMLYRITHFKY
jgi:tight adherence protein B